MTASRPRTPTCSGACAAVAATSASSPSSSSSCIPRHADAGRRVRLPRRGRRAGHRRGWRDLNAVAPRQATFTACVAGGPAGPIATLGFVWVGDPAEGRRLLPAMRALGRPVASRVTTPSYLDLQRRDDSTGGHAYRPLLQGALPAGVPHRGDRGVPAARRHRPDREPYLPAVGLQAHGGAIADVPDADAAFSHRADDVRVRCRLAAGPTRPRTTPGWPRPVRRLPSPSRMRAGCTCNALADEGSGGVRRATRPRSWPD